MIGFLFLLATAGQSFASPQEISLPAKIIDAIKANYSVDSLDLEPEIVDIDLEFKSRAGEQKVALGYSQEIFDLAQYVSRSDKSLSWKLASKYQIDNKNTTMYFFPRYKPFKSSLGATHGYECGTVFKYAKNIGELINSNALNIMTNDRQYLSILGGDYLVLHLEGKKLKMSYFKVRDTRWTHEMCKLDY